MLRSELAVSRVMKSERKREIHEMTKNEESYKSLRLEIFSNGLRPALQGWHTPRGVYSFTPHNLSACQAAQYS
jgi:hypothetical protein